MSDCSIFPLNVFFILFNKWCIVEYLHSASSVNLKADGSFCTQINFSCNTILIHFLSPADEPIQIISSVDNLFSLSFLTLLCPKMSCLAPSV